MKAVTNIKSLRKMEAIGFITLHPQTGTKITGLYSNKKFTCYYIDDGKPEFEYNGKKYAVKYVSGCFCPYVFSQENK